MNLSSLHELANLGVLLFPAWISLLWTVNSAAPFWSRQPDLQFGWMLLPLMGFLVWEEWEKRPSFQLRWRTACTLLAVFGLAALWWLQVYQAAFGVHAASLCGVALACQCCVAANLIYVFGPDGFRRFCFAFGFILIAMPLPSAIQGPVISNLQGLVASVNVEVLNLVGIPARRVGSLIQLPAGTVGVDEACSGIRSLQATIMATLFISRLTLSSGFLRCLLFAGGIALAVAGNICRSLFLSFTANAKGLQAVNTVHDAAGWSILGFTAIGVGVLAWGMGGLEKRMQSEIEKRKGVTC